MGRGSQGKLEYLVLLGLIGLALVFVVTRFTRSGAGAYDAGARALEQKPPAAPPPGPASPPGRLVMVVPDGSIRVRTSVGPGTLTVKRPGPGGLVTLVAGDVITSDQSFVIEVELDAPSTSASIEARLGWAGATPPEPDLKAVQIVEHDPRNTGAAPGGVEARVRVDRISERIYRSEPLRLSDLKFTPR